MTRRASSAVATAALIACSVCHVWTWLQVLRSFTNQDDQFRYTGPGFACMVLYMSAVCLFNWFALGSDSRIYRRVALLATALHLAAALLQGAAAQAVMAAGQENGWIVTLGVTVPAVPNLPLDSAQVITQLDSLNPWLTALFFALNLAGVILRLRSVPEKL